MQQAQSALTRPTPEREILDNARYVTESLAGGDAQRLALLLAVVRLAYVRGFAAAAKAAL
jgi:hypothetical protein